MILYLTTQDTDLLSLAGALAAARKAGEVWPPVVAQSLTAWALGDAGPSRFLDDHLPGARLVILRWLGGKKADPDVFERVVRHCRDHRIPLVAWPGEGEPDPELLAVTTLDARLAHQAYEYVMEGGLDNFGHLIRFLGHHVLNLPLSYEAPKHEPWCGIYWPGVSTPLDVAGWNQATQRQDADDERPVVGLFFYRAHWLSGNVEFVDDLVAALMREGCCPLPIFAQSLKISVEVDASRSPAALLNGAGAPRLDAAVITMSFATTGPGQTLSGVLGRVEAGAEPSWFQELDVPVYQALISLGSRQRWETSPMGLGPIETAMNVAIPEFDGRVIGVPICFREETPRLSPAGTESAIPERRYVSLPDRVDFLAKMVAAGARLRRLSPRERRLAFVLTNYPSKNSRIGNAVGLDTPSSLLVVLKALAEAGYDVGDVDELPETGDALMHRLIAAGTHDMDYLTQSQMESMAARLSVEDYAGRFSTLSPKVRHTMEERWGQPPGDLYVHAGYLAVPGLRFGNIFVGIQPPRSFGEDEVAVYHSPDVPPPHHYLGYYRWIRDDFGAHAIIHLGKHGTLEWLPGKGIGLSQDCFPEVALGALPNFYPFVVDDPGEGTQAKRRSHAVIVDHMVPPVGSAGLYNELIQLQQLLDQYYQAQTLDPTKLPIIQGQIWDLVVSIHLQQDLNQHDWPVNFDRFLQNIDGYLCELEAAQIRDGLHVLGTPPKSLEAWGELLYALLRLPNGPYPALPDAVCQALELSWDDLQDQLGGLWTHPVPSALGSECHSADLTTGDVRALVEKRCKAALMALADGRATDLASWSETLAAILDYARTTLIPKLHLVSEEIRQLLAGLDGRFVPPGPSGAPTRGMSDVLPTGKNFYSVDPRSLPSFPAWTVGCRLAAEILDRYREDTGTYPESVGIVVWGTAQMRTGGDDVAEILALLGVRPVWQKSSGRVSGLEVIPLEELGRPRVDVTVRMSGFFRDAFLNLVTLVHRAVEMVADQEEPFDMNPVRRHVLEDLALHAGHGHPEEMRRRALYRVFGSRPGTYGSGILPLLHSGQWQNQEDLAQVYRTWSSYAYTDKIYGDPASEAFERRMASIQVATKNQDNREHDIFDSDDYLQDHGGMVATIKSLTGQLPQQYFGDSANPERARVRSFHEEARRVFRSRVINPKWIRAAMEHHYKGALEMANTMDFLFGYDATAELLDDWMYEKTAEAYALDPAVQAFFRQSNPWALKDITERLLEASDRGLWENPDPETIRQLQNVLLDIDDAIEEWGSDDGK